MATYLRKVEKGRWHPREEYSDLEEGDIPADPLGDLQTSRNRLSVWRIENDEGDEEENRSNLNRIATAIAATRSRPDDIHYILISSDTLKELDIRVETSTGSTPDGEANRRWHCDLLGLSARKLLKMANALFGQVYPEMIAKEKIEEYLRAGLESKQLKQKSLQLGMLVKLGIVEPRTCPNCGMKIEF